jgi:hypothetical protein
MRKTVFFIIISFVLPSILSAQITKKRADKIVFEYIEKEITEYHWLYSSDDILPDEKGVTTISS